MSHSKEFLEELGIDIVYASTPNDSEYGTFESEWNGDSIDISVSQQLLYESIAH